MRIRHDIAAGLRSTLATMGSTACSSLRTSSLPDSRSLSIAPSTVSYTAPWMPEACFISAFSSRIASAGRRAGRAGGSAAAGSSSSTWVSTVTEWQCFRSASISSALRITKPWNRNGVSSHGRSSSDTYMPISRSVTAIWR
jgi:hypothetical protein